jgi:nucleoside 2-deoxyribosyltransferase
MAFGHSDTDAIYERCLAPTLRALSIQPVRVDRKEHNENINDVIMRELKQADFAIADLTYARPSVYFEAGFAERIAQVIYTVRKDHLRGVSDGERVHFDVSMRNIIGWSPEATKRFSELLRKRLVHVTRPLRDALAKDEARAQAANQFQHYSAQGRQAALLDEAVRSLRRAGFSGLGQPAGAKHWYWKRRGRSLLLVAVIAGADTSLRGFQKYEGFLDFMMDDSIGETPRLRPHLAKLEHIRRNAMFISTARVPRTSVAKYFPTCPTEQHTGALLKPHYQFRLSHPLGTHRDVPGQRRIYLLDAVASPRDLAERLSALIRTPEFAA